MMTLSHSKFSNDRFRNKQQMRKKRKQGKKSRNCMMKYIGLEQRKQKKCLLRFALNGSSERAKLLSLCSFSVRFYLSVTIIYTARIGP